MRSPRGKGLVAGKGNYLESIYFCIPGNTRWKCHILYRNPRLARRVETLLAGQSGLISVTANPNTGRLRVLYSARLPTDLVAAACEAAVQDALKGGGAPAPAGKRVMPVGGRWIESVGGGKKESIWPA